MDPMTTTTEVAHAAAEMHPDPEVQAAIVTLYERSPGLLTNHTFARLAVADGMDTVDLLDALRERQ